MDSAIAIGLILLVGIFFLIRFIAKEYIIDERVSTGTKILGVIAIIVIISPVVIIALILTTGAGGYAFH